MKKVMLLILVMLITACSKQTLNCKSSNTDEQGNINEIKYTFEYIKDVLETVDKNTKIKVKDIENTKFIYEMYGQTFNMFKDPGIKMSGSYRKNTINIFIKIDVDKIETVNEINSIAKMNYDYRQMSLFLEAEGYDCK